MPAPPAGNEALQPAKLACEQQEQRESDQTAKKNELFERISFENRLGTEIEAQSAQDAEENQPDRCADRAALSFLNHG